MKRNILKKILFTIGLATFFAMGLYAQITFPTFTNVTPAGTPQIFRGNVVWGDYNNDGWMDVIAVGRDISDGWKTNVFLLKNNGSGFDKITNLGIPSENVYNAVFAWIDYNNDGNLDLLYMGTAGGGETSDNGGNVFFHLYKNKGKNFNYAFEKVNDTGLEGLYIEQENQYASVIAVGDYDNDGYADILATGQRDGARYVSLYKNNKGEGTFTVKNNIVEGADFEPMSGGGTVFADLNSDGYLDIITNGWSNAKGDGYSSMYLNNNDGTYINTHWGDVISTSGQTKAGQTIVGDLNNDGFLDIITAGERYDGGAWPTNTNVYYFDSENSNSIKYTEKNSAAVGIEKIKKGAGDMVDLNSDGLLDIVLVGEGTGTHTTIYMAKEDGTYEYKHDLITAARGGAVLSMADFNNDGYVDAAVTGYGSGSVLAIWKNDGNLTKNTAPSAPQNLQSSYANGQITFTWDAGSDIETPAKTLRYNFYLKKADGEISMLIPADIQTGYLKVADHTIALTTTSYTLNIPKGTYEWGVQTIDQGKMPSGFATATISSSGNDQEIVNGDWRIIYSEDSRTMEYIYKDKSLLSGIYVQAKNQTELLKSSDYTIATISQESINDQFGNGEKYTVNYSGLTATPDLQQVFYFYPDKDYFLTEAYIQSATSTSSNYIAPLVTKTRSSFLTQDVNNRVLTIPFDNDGFIRYGSYPLSLDSLSFEVTSIFNGAQRNGLVIGSVEHDTWKTGVRFSTSNNRYIESLECFGGITHKLTRDINKNTTKEHGSISGKSLKSPKILVGYFDDWRRGMEQYGDANAVITPPRRWEKDTPFGWNSWGGMETKVNYEGVMDVSDFIKNELAPKNFKSNAMYIGLDSYWSENFTEQQLIEFVKHCNENGQEAGIYWCPFSDWGSNGDRIMEGTNGQYAYKDAYLYASGKPISIESRALDPTHPGTKLMMKYYVDRFKAWGFKYIKIDFINNGTLEADSFFDSSVTTGVQAYNQGMQHFVDLCGDDIFIALSIAPTFPAQYGHSKRISCDTWGEMSEHESHTGYMLNSLSFGWWLDRVYPFNDSDHLILAGYSDGANRARITSGVITGIYMLGDNLSLKGTYPGTQAIRQKDLNYATNADVNEIARYGKSFYPVEGYMASAPDRSENFFTLEVDKYIYLAVFNFNETSSLTGNMNLSKLGISSSIVKGIKELWMGATVNVQNNAIPYSVPSKDVRIYRIEKQVEVLTNPEITEQPVSLEKFVGESATFTVEAIGGSLTYQWYKDDVVINKATSKFLSISNISLSHAGKYHCVVSNAKGSATTSDATLMVYTQEVALKGIIVNGNNWDIKNRYILNCSSPDITTIEVDADATSKVIYEENIAADNKIFLNISTPSIRNITFGIQSQDGTMTKKYVLSIEKYFDFDKLVVARWDNTLIANNNSATNGGFKFNAYKWFKDGTLVGNNPSYSAGPRRNSLLDKESNYYLQVTTTDGDILRTCASKVTLKSIGITVYPNPVSANESLNVLVDMEPELIEKAVIEVHSMTGLLVTSKKVEGRDNLVNLPASTGNYFVTVKSGDFKQTLKVVVK